MKFSIIDSNNFKIYINNEYEKFNYENDDELYDSLKKILTNIRKKYAFNIYGYYEVDIYNLKEIATILYFQKKDEDSSLYKTVDLKIIKKEENDIYIKFSDYFFIQKKLLKYIKKKNNNFYINIKYFDAKKLINIIEHIDFIPKEMLDDIY